MKSVLQAGWLMTVAFGNVIVLIVAEGGGMEQVSNFCKHLHDFAQDGKTLIPWFCDFQWAEFLLFAGLLVAVSIIFSIMAFFYTYVDPDQLDKVFPDDDGNVDSSKSKKNETVYMTDMPKKTKI